MRTELVHAPLHQAHVTIHEVSKGQHTQRHPARRRVATTMKASLLRRLLGEPGRPPTLGVRHGQAEHARVEAAGFEVLGTRKVSDQAWEDYFAPIDARIAALRADADAALTAVLDEAEEEAACWRAHRDEAGYLLLVVRPK